MSSGRLRRESHSTQCKHSSALGVLLCIFLKLSLSAFDSLGRRWLPWNARIRGKIWSHCKLATTTHQRYTDPAPSTSYCDPISFVKHTQMSTLSIQSIPFTCLLTCVCVCVCVCPRACPVPVVLPVQVELVEPPVMLAVLERPV